MLIRCVVAVSVWIATLLQKLIVLMLNVFRSSNCMVGSCQAARGIGRGIALQLGGARATVTVYITGRTLVGRGRDCSGSSNGPLSRSRSGEVVQEDPAEQVCKLDRLVNNAYAGVNTRVFLK